MIDDALRTLVEEVVRRVIREELASALRSATAAESTYISIRQAAQLVGVSPNTVRSWFERGLPYQRIERVVRIRRGDLDRFLATRSEMPAPDDYAAEILGRRERR